MMVAAWKSSVMDATKINMEEKPCIGLCCSCCQVGLFVDIIRYQVPANVTSLICTFSFMFNYLFIDFFLYLSFVSHGLVPWCSGM